jgi:hypothetical protein
MSLYKSNRLIPKQPTAATEQPTPPAETPVPRPDHTAPTSPATGTVTADQATTPASDGTAAETGTVGAGEAPTTAPPLPWTNGRWTVTDAGLESLTRAGPHDRQITYVVPASELLKCLPGAPGVSSWAIHLAGKTWVDDVDALIEAIAQALNRLHPGQTAIDMVATAERARAEWARSRPNPAAADPHHMGVDYFEMPRPWIERAVAKPRPEGAKDWTSEFPPQHREMLRVHGMDPDDHAAARAYDHELIRYAEAGLTGEALADAAGALWDQHFFEREKEAREEDGMPAELEFLIEGRIHGE